MNRKIFRTIGGAAVIGACTAFMYAPASLAASDDEKQQIERAEQIYIGEVSQYCNNVLFGEKGIPAWNERNGTAYKSCLREYGVIFSYAAKDPEPDDISSPETYGYEVREMNNLDRGNELERAREGIAKAAKAAKSGKQRNLYSLTDKGRRIVAERLEAEGVENAYRDLAPRHQGAERQSTGRSSTERISKEKKSTSKSPVYIYNKPKSDEDSSTSRVFKGYQ